VLEELALVFELFVEVIELFVQQLLVV